MRRAARVALLGALLAGLLGPVVQTAGAPPASAARVSPAVQQLGGCLAAQQRGDLLLLVDQSASLRTTDPGDARVAASQYLLERLAAQFAKGDAEVDVAVTGFDVDFRGPARWQRLDPDGLAGLESQVQAFAERDSGLDTDYVQALSGARDALRDKARSADGEEQRCQAVLWFSDGQYDVEPRSSDARRRQGTSKPYAPGVDLRSEAGAAQAEQQGRQALCRSGGVADQLRATGVLTFGVGLGASGADYTLMRGLATGAGCGKATRKVVGEFLLAKQIEDLVFAFGKLGAPLDLETACTSGVECAHSFVLDGSINAAHVLAGADEPGVAIEVRPPGGAGGKRFLYTGTEREELTTVAGQELRARWLSDKTLELDLVRRSDRGWVGQWSLGFVKDGALPRRIRSQITITGDLVPAVAGDLPDLRSDDEAAIRLGLASEVTGKPVDPASVLGEAALSAELVLADGTARRVLPPTRPTALRGPVPLDLAGVAPGAATLRLVLSVRTAGVPARPGVPAAAGTQLADRQVDVPLQVMPPLDFPAAAPRLDLGRFEGTGPVEGALRVTGPGCVWLQGWDVTGSPDGVGEVRVTSAASSAATCRTVGEGETGELPVALQLAQPGNGLVAGSLRVALAPEGAPDRAVATQVRLVADAVRPQDRERLLGVFALALLLGVGLPVAFLYLARWWVAKVPGRGLLVASLPVEVSDGRVTRPDGQPFTFSHHELRLVSVDRAGVRRLALPQEGVELRTRTGLSPTADAWTQVLAGDRTVLTAHRGRLPLAVHNSWAALVGPGEPVRVLVLLSADSATPETYARTSLAVRELLPQQVAGLREQSGEPAAPVPAAPAPAGVPTTGWGPGGPGAGSSGRSTGGWGPAGPSTPGTPGTPPPSAPGAGWGPSASS